jgi:hypothetical protein
MKFRITKTVEVPDELLDTAVELARSSGHGYDGENKARVLIRRMLEDAVVAATVRIMDHHRNPEGDE